MAWLSANRTTLVWLLLFCATGLSWLVAHEDAAGIGHGHESGSIAILCIALIKIRFVLIHFMELGHAPWVWRAIFEAWLLIVGVAMLATYFIVN